MSENSIDIRALSRAQAGAAAGLLGRGMRDNPTHIQAFGSDPARRERTLMLMFTPFLRQQMRTGVALGAFFTSSTAAPDASPSLAGVASVSAPGRCQPSLTSKLLALPAFLHGGGPQAALRMRAWVRVWAQRDKQAPMHWHLGPLAVLPQHQGRGIGSALLQRLCDHLDRHQALGYLETDRVENVTLYQRFGFSTVATQDVIGTPHWFMQREPARAGKTLR